MAWRGPVLLVASHLGVRLVLVVCLSLEVESRQLLSLQPRAAGCDSACSVSFTATRAFTFGRGSCPCPVVQTLEPGKATGCGCSFASGRQPVPWRGWRRERRRHRHRRILCVLRRGFQPAGAQHHADARRRRLCGRRGRCGRRIRRQGPARCLHPIRSGVGTTQSRPEWVLHLGVGSPSLV
jgi:hypothetical protein